MREVRQREQSTCTGHALQGEGGAFSIGKGQAGTASSAACSVSPGEMEQASPASEHSITVFGDTFLSGNWRGAPASRLLLRDLLLTLRQSL